MTRFSSELSGSLIFNSGSTTAELQPYSGGVNISGSELYINTVALTTRLESIESGFAGSASLLPLNLHSASVLTYTASNNLRVGALESSSANLNLFSSSIQAQVNTLQSVTSSYLTTTGDNVISSSTQISNFGFLTSASAAALGFGSGGEETPAGTISSSQQIEDLGYITGSPVGTVSSSQQISDLGFITSSTETDSIALGVIHAYTASTDDRLAAIEAATSSYATGSHTSITALNLFTSSYYTDSASFDSRIDSISVDTSSLDSRLASLEAATSSYATGSHTDITALNTFTSSYYTDSASFDSRINNISIDTGSLLTTASYLIDSASFDNRINSITSSDITFDGNKIVSNEYLEGLFSASFNAGTTGSIQEFLNAIFFPNSAPSFTGGVNYTVAEFSNSGSLIGTLTGNDLEGDSLTFSTSSEYIDDFVRVSTNGNITLNVVPTQPSFNTDDRGDGTLAHPVQVELTDPFDARDTRTIYINVTPNTAPKFRETSTIGNIITSFNQNRNESAGLGEVTKIYFTDDESDSITIRTGSDANGHFSMSLHTNYVRIYQTTASLDYEGITAYSMSITASDEHYEAAQDTGSISTIFVGVTVVDNIQPSINNQTLAGINENSTDGTSAGTVTATDPESNTITFNRFALQSLELDGTPVPTGSYGGTSQANDPHENAFEINAGTGQVTRKTGVFINSDLINTYKYLVTVRDSYNETSSSAVITIPIADDPAPSLTGVQQFYVIESAVSGDNVYDSPNGYSGTIADFNSNQSPITWSVSSSNDFTVNSSGNLLLSRNISGSLNTSGSLLSGSITASNAFGTQTSTTFSVRITENTAPDIIFSDTTANQNTNLARSGSTLVTLTFSDAEGDTIDYAGVTFENTGSQLNAIQSGTTWLIQAKENLSASTYTYTASVDDEHSFRTNTENDSFTIAAASIGTLEGDTTSYIIESAVSGAVLRDATGFGAGNTSQLSVSYSPNYGSAIVQSFTSSNAAIVVDNSGNLTLGINLSGSATSSGDTINTNITFRDQFNNIGSGSVTVNVFANIAPTAVFTNQTANLTASVESGSYLVGVSITDVEGDTPYSMSLSGISGSLLRAIPLNANSSSYQIQNVSTLGEGIFPYSASIVDNFGKAVNYNRELSVASVPFQVYLYGYSGGTPSSEAAAFGTLGDVGGDGVGVQSGSVIAMFESGALGTTFSPSFVGGTATVIASSSLSTLSNTTGTGTGIASLGYADFSSTAQIALILFPSASVVGDKPKTMFNGALPDSTPTNLEYALYAKDIAIPGVSTSAIYYFDLESAHLGYTNWGMILQTGQNNNNSRLYLMPDSASAP